MIPSIGIPEIVFTLGVIVVIFLVGFLIVRIARGVPSKTDRD